MERFKEDYYYSTTDPALELIGKRGTLAQWRHKGEGPSYVRLGNKILYEGATLNAWLDAHRVQLRHEHEHE